MIFVCLYILRSIIIHPRVYFYKSSTIVLKCIIYIISTVHFFKPISPLKIKVYKIVNPAGLYNLSILSSIGICYCLCWRLTSAVNNRSLSSDNMNVLSISPCPCTIYNWQYTSRIVVSPRTWCKLNLFDLCSLTWSRPSNSIVLKYLYNTSIKG